MTPKSSSAELGSIREKEKWPSIRAKAEEIKIPRFVVMDACLDECISNLRRQSQFCDFDEVISLRGVNFRSEGSESANPVTLSLRRISVWDAAQRIAGAAGLELSVTDAALVIHPKGAGPALLPPLKAAVAKCAVWQRAEKVVFERVQFWEATAPQVCTWLSRKSDEIAGERRGVNLSSEGEWARTITMDLRNVKLTDCIMAVAEVIRGEIIVSGGRVILKPGKRED